MCDILDSKGDQAVIDAVREKVSAICARLPVYQH
jgi:glycine hydroxymethyltransferase